jgi:plastocyanin
MVPRIFLGTAAAALALGLAGCGADDTVVGPTASGGDDGQSAGVTVVARDFSLSQAGYSADAGPVHVTYRNDGSIEHTLVIEGVDGFKLDVHTKGDVDDGSVTLEPGRYTFYCDIPGHRQAGMHATLTVQ